MFTSSARLKYYIFRRIMENIVIGQIVKPQGIKGELKVKPLTNDQSVFNGLKSVFIDGKERVVTSSVFRFGFAYIMLEGLTDRTSAEAYRNKKLSVPKRLLGGLDEGEYLVADLEGLEVKNERGQSIGKIEGVESYGGADILLIRERGKLFRVAFLKEIFKDVDLNDKVVLADQTLYDLNKLSD